MKLVSFSPWQHTTTSIPSSKGGDEIIQKFIIAQPSSFLPPSKRIKPSKPPSAPSLEELKPLISVTSSHAVSILGHQSSNKILRTSSSSAENETSVGKPKDDGKTFLNEIPEWIYMSRPGPSASFFPSKGKNGKASDHRRVGVAVDSASRTVFALQKDNCIMKIWGLDDDINGPDDGDIEKIQFDSAVICMESIPVKRQIAVKIKGKSGGDPSQTNPYVGGVAGLLTNGQMFVVLVSSVNNMRKITLGIYGKATKKEGSNGSRRVARRTTKRKSVGGTDENEHLYSFVNFTLPNTMESQKVDLGQKRKLDSIECKDVTSGEWGEITLYILSLNPKNHDSITLAKHTVVISSQERHDDSDEKKSSSHHMIGGTYSKKVGDVKLPHAIFKQKENGSSHNQKDVLVSQLEHNQVGLVYKDSANTWYVTVLDTRYGECTNKTFPVRHTEATNSTIIDIAGLNQSILAILTSDDVLSVYDARRSLKLHETKLLKVLGKEENGVKYKFAISAHWMTGIIGITCNSIANSTKDSGSTISISCAQVGIYDTDETGEVIDMKKKPFKGSYNLSRIISSTMLATHSEKAKLLSNYQKVEPKELNMTSWFPSTEKKNSSSSFEKTMALTISDLEMYRLSSPPQNGSKSKSFLEKFEEIVTKLKKEQESATGGGGTLLNGTSSRAYLPQVFIDVSISVAIDIILRQDKNPTDKIDAAKVMFQCIETGKVSGRIHFDKSKISNLRNHDILRSILFVLQAQSKDIDNDYLPIRLIGSLLQYCKDGLTEQMFVSMIHFILCHSNEQQVTRHWDAFCTNKWYNDPSVKVLEKRLKTATTKFENAKAKSSERFEDLEKLVHNLRNRLSVCQQLFFIEKIVTHSKCNPALLRSSLRNGLTQASSGEVEVLILALGKLIERSGNERKKKSCDLPNKSMCVGQWLSAVVDSNFNMLLLGSDPKIINRVGKGISASISQTRAFLSLKELFSHVDQMIGNEAQDEDIKVEVNSVPLYGIEPLIF